MEWKFVTLKGEDSKSNNAFKMDIVGNIFQKNGGVKPIACQKCKIKFKSKIREIPIKQKIPSYKCKNCDFENSEADAALDHKITTDHKIKKITKDRIVGVKKQLIDNIASINPINNDVEIICKDCSNG